MPISDSIRKLLDAIRQVETGGLPNKGQDAVGDAGKALGPYQIWKVYWKDATEFDKSIGGTYEDVKKKEYAEKVMLAYWRRYCPNAYRDPSKLNNLEIMARIHNGGPKGYEKPATLNYWVRVKSHLGR